MRYCQDLWMSSFRRPGDPALIRGWLGRSTRRPIWKRAPGRTRVTRWDALTARQRRCAGSTTLKAIATSAAREPEGRLDRVRRARVEPVLGRVVAELQLHLEIVDDPRDCLGPLRAVEAGELSGRSPRGRGPRPARSRSGSSSPAASDQTTAKSSDATNRTCPPPHVTDHVQFNSASVSQVGRHLGHCVLLTSD